jgi:hypothetical protein
MLWPDCYTFIFGSVLCTLSEPITKFALQVVTWQPKRRVLLNVQRMKWIPLAFTKMLQLLNIVLLITTLTQMAEVARKFGKECGHKEGH